MKREARRQKREARRDVLMAVVMAFALMGPVVLPEASGQIILQDEELDVNWRNSESGDNIPLLPWLGLTTDQYAPLDGGILLLGCLGGAYLLGKRKKESSIAGSKNKK